jgi:hypothetical protein
MSPGDTNDNLPNSYSHVPNNTPPYVLDTITKAHYKDQLVNNNINTIDEKSTQPQHFPSGSHKNDVTGDEDYVSFSNDIYISHLDSSWKNFLGSIKDPKLFPKVKNVQSYNDKYDLMSGWNGDHRLKAALLGSDDELSTELNRSWGNTAADSETSKFRSTAGYWMTKQKRAEVLPTVKKLLIVNPLIPLLLRVLIVIFSACALGMACTIYQQSREGYDGIKIDQQASTIMCIVVSTFVIVYLIYIAHDEYNGKPVGLRNPLEKVNYVLFDTVFMIFSSANLTLAFNTLFDDRWVCRPLRDAVSTAKQAVPVITSICRRERAMTSFLFITICLWILVFTLAVTRIIARVTPRE